MSVSRPFVALAPRALVSHFSQRFSEGFVEQEAGKATEAEPDYREGVKGNKSHSTSNLGFSEKGVG